MAGARVRGYTEGMDKDTALELESLAGALALSRGEAPARLAEELSGGDICAVSRTPAAARSLRNAALSLACLFGVFAFCATFDAAPARARRVAARRPVPVDHGARAAIARVQEWSLAGDDLTVLQRLDGVTRHHGGMRAWSAERVGAEVYLVLYRAPAGLPVYAFEADLAADEVRATPEAVDALTVMRVRDAEAHGLFASR